MSASSTACVVPAAVAQDVALVMAVETVDRRGHYLAQDARRQATETARSTEQPRARLVGASDVRETRWLGARAALLVPQIFASEAGAASPLLSPRLLAITDPARGVLGLAIAAGLIVGLLTNALGPSRQIHVLALPLLGILAWNLAVFALIVVRRLVPGPRMGAPRGLALLTQRLRSLGERSVRRAARHVSDARSAADRRKDAEANVQPEEIVARYLATWTQASTPLAVARVARALHAGSLALLAGVVAGMYLRGLGFAYQAAWESTFLSAPTVQRLLDTILGPASALSGIHVPSVASLAEQAGTPTGAATSAAPWIHLWALTAAWAVGLPRLLLLATAAWQCRARGRNVTVTLPADYRRRLLSAADPEARRIDVLLYSYQVAAAATARLKTALLDVFGARSEVRLRALRYGEEVFGSATTTTAADGTPNPSSDSAVDGEATLGQASDPSVRCRLVLFSLAQTPEAEVHGEVVAELAASLGDGQALLVLVDASAYRQRLGEGGEARIADRREAWGRVLRAPSLHAPGLAPLHVDLAAEEGRAGARDASAGETAGLATDSLLDGAWPVGVLDALRRVS